MNKHIELKKRLIDLPLLKQKDIATALGVSETYISHALRGRRKAILVDIEIIINSHSLLKERKNKNEKRY